MVGFSGQVGAFSEEDLKKLKATGSCVKCDLSGANLSWSNLTEADLTEANLTEENLEGVNLTQTIFCTNKMPDESINDSGC